MWRDEIASHSVCQKLIEKLSKVSLTLPRFTQIFIHKLLCSSLPRPDFLAQASHCVQFSTKSKLQTPPGKRTRVSHEDYNFSFIHPPNVNIQQEKKNKKYKSSLNIALERSVRRQTVFLYMFCRVLRGTKIDKILEHRTSHENRIRAQNLLPLTSRDFFFTLLHFFLVNGKIHDNAF